MSNGSTLKLHTFCDVSEKAYDACVYLRVVDVTGIMVHLLRAKSRVAALKTISLPRLALYGLAILGVDEEAAIFSHRVREHVLD